VASFHTLHTEVVSSYALGWTVSPELVQLGQPGLTHAGTNLRWFANTWFSPAADAGLLVVCNGGGDRGNAAVAALDLLMRRRIASSP